MKRSAEHTTEKRRREPPGGLNLELILGAVSSGTKHFLSSS